MMGSARRWPDEFDSDFSASFERVHPDDRDALGSAVGEAIASCGLYHADFRVQLPGGGLRWLTARGRAYAGPDGRAQQLLGIAFDVTEIRTVREADEQRARAAQLQAEAAASRLQLLASVSVELAAFLDTEAAVARLAQLVVPALGDWCIVTLAEDDGLRDIGWWHVDPDLRIVVERYATTRHERSEVPRGPPLGPEIGQAAIIRQEVTCRMISRLGSREAAVALRELAPESCADLPLVARGRSVGVLSLCNGAGRAPMSDDEITVAKEVAVRAALALDNARLYSEQRTLAEGLQRSLLTDPPQPDHCHIVVRYVPAAETASVGGDWFDSFLQDDGATVLVIGDVVGHNTEAAAAMGLLRGLLRGIAWHGGGTPAEVLSGLDAAMKGLQVDTTATAIVARFEQTAEEESRQIRRLRWSNAGHPPPMVIHPDGTISTLTTAQPDLLLGVDPLTRRGDSVTDLEPGSTVLLFTDGLVERRGQSLDNGLALLHNALGDISDRPLDVLCDELLHRMIPDRAEDDVALLAVRLHPQDRSRPTEAGAVQLREPLERPGP